ncbi:MAG: Asp-tRNA(Asn)/Glu-tRNA(Gln) amidotransferase subunit GatC [Dehalococcoidia bacterium]|nr:Asp-tRNA(Asn)/Glu-tRNA(Gln) amidotransferase subunit GatC [Dehalococcoidia bacterium]
MALSREDVKHVASLVRIAVTDAEVEVLQHQLSNTLEQFESLKELNTDAVQPTSHAVPLSSVMREDKSRDPMPKQDVLKNAPMIEGDFIRVRVVLEES